MALTTETNERETILGICFSSRYFKSGERMMAIVLDIRKGTRSGDEYLSIRRRMAEVLSSIDS
jgi:hypothetical protein